MDVRLINPFLLGAKDVLSTMAYVETDIGKPYVKQDERATGDVSGIIGLTGDAIGSLAISFSEACICGIAQSMLGESFPHANQEVFDAVGELTNMISGVSRTYLEKETMTVWAGIPAVVYGKGHRVRHILKSPSIVIPFTTKYGSFFVDVCIKATVKKAVRRQDQKIGTPVKFALDGKLPPIPAMTAAEEVMLDLPSPGASETTPGMTPEMTPDERIEFLKKQLEETKAIKESLENLLKDKPFMNFQMRQKYKKAIPVYDAKMKRIRMDISAIEMLRAVPVDGDVAIELPRHYQNYPAQKPPRQRR